MPLSHPKVAFIPTNVSGVMHYRCWQQAEAMRAIGVEVAVLWYSTKQFLMHPWEEDILREDVGYLLKNDISKACEWADIVIWMGLHTTQSLALFHSMRIYHAKPFLTEIDDYIYAIPNRNIASTVYTPGSGLTRILTDQMQSSDGIICSTPYLADLYKNVNKTYVAENFINFPSWRSRFTSPRRQGVTIGWVGGGTHDEDHELIKDSVFEVLSKNKDVRFKYVCGGPCPEFFKGVPRLTWQHDFSSIKQYPKWVAKKGFDIGIAPLEDNNFNRGKSNLRWLEYSALGIPCVASPLPHFKESIVHGKTGFIASTHGEWVEHLERLINAPDLRDTIGTAARQEVKDKWNPKVMGRKYLNIIKEILNAKSNAVNISDPDRGLDRRPLEPEVVGV